MRAGRSRRRTQVAVFRLRDGLRAVSGLPARRWAAGRRAQADPTGVVCPLHGYAYSVTDGACLNGDFSIPVHPVRDEGGEIVVDLS